jgi:signal transduction histidine kinase
VRKWRSSAAYKIAFAYSAAAAVGVIVVGLAIFWAMHAAFTDQLDGVITDEARGLVAEYRQEGRTAFLDGIKEREASRSSTTLYYAVFRADGRRIAGTLNTTRPSLGTHDIGFIDSDDDDRGELDEARGYAIDLNPNERLLVAADRDWIERGDRTVLAVFGGALSLTIVLGLAGAAAFGSFLRRRLRSISGGAEAIIAGDLRERMPVSSRGDEFDQLAATLNRMLDRIEGLLDNLRQVSSDLAHDLRTPLARLRNSLETGLSANPRNDPAVAVVEDAIKRLDDVLSLFSAILRIAEVESGETRRYFKSVDLSALGTELAESYAPAIHDGGRILLWSIEPGLRISGDPELLAQAAINLLENAQRHTPAGTIIRLTAVSTNGVAKFRVLDSGPGVPKGDLGRITKRFARLEASRSTAGHGLGLSLVRAIARLHGGRLVLEAEEPGLSATIELPIDPHHPSQSPKTTLQE